MLLAIDTVFSQCSVALLGLNGNVVYEQTFSSNREQTKQILPMIETALQHANMTVGKLTAIIFNQGPGGFSGIRINTAVTQALAFAHDLPCVGVSSLAVLAQSAWQKHGLDEVYVALDARMNQVYFARYSIKGDEYHMTPVVENSETHKPEADERLLDYGQFSPKSLPIVGNGAKLLDLHPTQQTFTDVYPDAVTLATLGIYHYNQFGGVAADNALPVYIRNNAWKTLAEQGK